jgi:chromatin remodeling complex protein RSC6
MPAVKKTQNKKSSAGTKKQKEVEEVVVEEVVVEEVVVEEVVPKVKQRVVVDKESISIDFDSVISDIANEIQTMRSSSDGKTKGVQFLRGLNARIQKLKKHSLRIAKGKKKVSTNTNTTSGFRKPVDVSDEMSKFAGWNTDEMHSRVDVTQFICNYIKEKDLQNPSDRRLIIPDAKLKKLLGLKGKDADEPLPYYMIQRHIKPHFPSKNATA